MPGKKRRSGNVGKKEKETEAKQDLKMKEVHREASEAEGNVVQTEHRSRRA